MTVDSFAGTFYWIRLGLLSLIALLALIAMFRLMRTRRFSTGRAVSVFVFQLIALVGLWLITGASPSPIWLIVALAIGGVLGFVTGRIAKPAPGGGDKLKRSPVPAAITAIAFIFAGMTLLFGTSYLFSIALLGVAMGVGLFGGQFAGEMMAARNIAMPPDIPPMPVQAPPMPAAAPPPMPVEAPPMPASPPPMPEAPPMPAQSDQPTES